ncbi:13973_t:CDS:2 [Entrophospora sp. SA101]|nr:13973_t:CDS:2 [Entrophospora sp. SA101]
MSNSSRLDLGVWLRPRIYPLTEDKTSSTYYYHLLSYDRNSNEPYQSVSRHQFLLHVGRFFLANEPNNFRHVSRTLLSSVIGDLVRSASGSELLKATVYCRYFNALIREDNRANQIDRNRRLEAYKDFANIVKHHKFNSCDVPFSLITIKKYCNGLPFLPFKGHTVTCHPLSNPLAKL